MKLHSLNDLFIYLLCDIYNFENKILTELPKMLKKVDSQELKEGIQHHLAETKNQVKRLDQVFKLIHSAPKKLEWTQDVDVLFADANAFLTENSPSPVLDAAIITICQRVEHYEIATYGTLIAFADAMDNSEVKKILKETIKEESHADELLTKVAEGGIFKAGVNTEATRR